MALNLFSTIPSQILINENLEPKARLLFGLIGSLTQNEYGYCWATNDYFAEIFQVDVRTVKRWLSSLKAEKVIKVEVAKDGIKTYRKIWICLDFQKMFAKGHFCPPRGDIFVPPPTPGPYIYNNINTITPPISPPQDEDKKMKKGEPSPAAQEMSEYLLKKIKEINPEFSESTRNWPKIFDQMLKKKPPERLKSLIDWTFNNDFWKTVIVSASGLNKNIAKLEAKANGDIWKQTKQENNNKRNSNETSIPLRKKTLEEDMLAQASRKEGAKILENLLEQSKNGGKKAKTS